MNRKGKIQIFTGEGKGKTTAALGLALKAVCENRKVFVVQFLKPPDSSGEHFSAKAFPFLLTILPMGRKGFIRKSRTDSSDTARAKRALEEARNAMTGGGYDVIILDEVNVAVYMGLIDPSELLEFMDSLPDILELILTGRYALPEVMKRADEVYEAKNIKHPFDRGVAAKEGIEY